MMNYRFNYLYPAFLLFMKYFCDFIKFFCMVSCEKRMIVFAIEMKDKFEGKWLRKQ